MKFSDRLKEPRMAGIYTPADGDEECQEIEWGGTIDYSTADDGYKYVSKIDLEDTEGEGFEWVLMMYEWLLERLPKRFDSENEEEVYDMSTKTWIKTAGK